MLVKIGQAATHGANVCMSRNGAQEGNKILLVSGRISFAFLSLVYFYVTLKFGKAVWYCHIHLSISLSQLTDFHLIWCGHYPTVTHKPLQQTQVMLWRLFRFLICLKKGGAKD